MKHNPIAEKRWNQNKIVIKENAKVLHRYDLPTTVETKTDGRKAPLN